MMNAQSSRLVALMIVLVTLSCALTGAGFMIANVPIAVAYIPFAITLLIPPRPGKRTTVMALMAGHFLWPTLISGWGLVRLDFNPVVILVGGVATILVVSYGFARLGLAISAALLLALPFFPANPLLVTGSLFPGAGLAALPVILLWVKLIEIQRGFVTRCAFLLTLIAASPIITLWFEGTQPARPSSVVYDEIDISDARGLTERGYWTQIMNRTGGGDVLVLGENMITHDDHAGINWWCNEATTRNMIVIMGVMGATGIGEVWRFDHDTCPAPLPLYRAEIGIPMVNAGWWPATGDAPQHEDAEPAIQDTQWLICFEAFSLWRWIDVARSDADHGVILANDHWTAPFTTTLLRRKVAAQFAALFQIDVHHADNEKSALWVRRPQFESPGHLKLSGPGRNGSKVPKRP